MEEASTNKALRKLRPSERPFIIARSTFAGSGRKAAHWLGDNYSSWSSMWTSLQGVMQFGIFGIPMVGADACGFNVRALPCGRAKAHFGAAKFRRGALQPVDAARGLHSVLPVKLSCPDSRRQADERGSNHNTKAAISQEASRTRLAGSSTLTNTFQPFRWDSVAEATRTAVHIRYSLLPYFVRDERARRRARSLILAQYSEMARASLYGTPPIRALWQEFPDDTTLFGVSEQFMVGRCSPPLFATVGSPLSGSLGAASWSRPSSSPM